MLTAKRRQTSWAVAASAIAHAAVLTLLALHQTTLRAPVDESGPPPAIIPVLLVPRTPPPAAGHRARPEPIRLHRRPQPFVPPEVTPAPIAPPSPPATTPPAPKAPVVVLHPAPQPEGPKGDVRTALRQGPVGCANPLAVGLNKAERDLCDEKLGKGAKDAPAFATGMELTAAKKAALDRAAGDREADYRYRRTTPSGTVPPGAGATAEEMCKQLGVDPEECKAKSRR